MKQPDDLQQLYRKTVLEHSRQPRNFRRLENASSSCEGHNPLCGDKLTVYIDIGEDSIRDIAFEGAGCAISLASASIMTESVRGKPVNEARESINRVIDQFSVSASDQPVTELGDMAALSSVRKYPSRIKCATLAWKTLDATLAGTQSRVTTE
jgi:nitrogen fixation NifU-like protein